MRAVEREDAVVEDGHGNLRLLRGVEEAEPVAREAVHDGVEIHLRDALEAPDVERVLAQELARAALGSTWRSPPTDGGW